MQRLSNGTQVSSLPAPLATSGTPGYATAGNPAVPLQASEWDADQYNRMQEEIIAPILAAGISLDPGNNAQLLAAIQKLTVWAGGGANQNALGSHAIKLGLDTTSTALRATVDSYDIGVLATLPQVYAEAALCAKYADFILNGSTNGYQKLPSTVGSAGAILQWGTGTTATGNLDVIAFPIAFPGGVMSILASEGASGGWNLTGHNPSPTIYGTSYANLAQFFLSAVQIIGGVASYAPNVTYRYIAIGY